MSLVMLAIVGAVLLGGLFFFVAVAGLILAFTGKKPKSATVTVGPSPPTARTSDELLGDAGEVIERESLRKAWKQVGQFVSDAKTNTVADAIAQGAMASQIARQLPVGVDQKKV